MSSNANLFRSDTGWIGGLCMGCILPLPLFLSDSLDWGLENSLLFQNAEVYLLISLGFLVAILMIWGGGKGGFIKDVSQLLSVLFYCAGSVLLMVFTRAASFRALWSITSIFTFLLYLTFILVTRYGYISFRTNISYLAPVWFSILALDAMILSLISVEVWVLTVVLAILAIILTERAESFEYHQFCNHLKNRMQSKEELINLHSIPNISVERFIKLHYLSKIIAELNQQLSTSYGITLDENGCFCFSSKAILVSSQDAGGRLQGGTSKKSTASKLQAFFKETEPSTKWLLVLLCAVLVLITLAVTWMFSRVFALKPVLTGEELLLIGHAIFFAAAVLTSGVFAGIYVYSVDIKGISGEKTVAKRSSQSQKEAC